MASHTKIALCLICALGAAPAWAEEAAFKPESVTVKAAIDPGPNVFLNKQEWGGAGSIGVYSEADLTFKGLMSAGAMGQILVSPDGKTAYSQSTYMKRIMHGDVEQVLEVYDVATLSPVKEVILPPRAAMVAAYDPLLQQSADGKFIYVQNATPATSVTVVDIAEGKVVQEVPTPGCWGIYPAKTGYKFSSLCGDGSVASFALSDDGATSEKSASAPIFDADKDALFVDWARVGDDLVFVSFGGNIYKISDAATAAALTEKIPLGVDGWAPGGYGLLTYNEPNGILFVGMHADAKEGSHKDAATEVWAYDLANKKLLYRSPVEHLISITATQDAIPVLFGLNEDDGKVFRYEADPEAKFVLKKTAEKDDTGYATVVAVRK